MSRHWTTNKNYITIGDWSWDHTLLNSKIVRHTDPDACTEWSGSMSPTGALFGARKLGHQQMTQTRRLVWAEANNQDPTPYRIAMRCRNQSCLNTRHFEIFPSNRKPKF